MAVFRIEKTRDYTVMSNHHLRDKSLSLKAKGLLSLMLSLPEEWDYTTKGLARICKDGVDSICAGVRELEEHGYVIRQRVRNPNGQLGAIEYTILEQPRPPEPKPQKPERENPVLDNPEQASPVLEEPEQGNPAQLNTNRSSNGYREISRRQKCEALFSELSEEELAQLAVYDRYSWEYTAFPVGGAVILIEDDRLAEALNALPQDNRDIFLMYWFLDMADREIAEYMNMARRTVNTRRQKAYRLLKELMGGEADD